MLLIGEGLFRAIMIAIMIAKKLRNFIQHGLLCLLFSSMPKMKRSRVTKIKRAIGGAMMDGIRAHKVMGGAIVDGIRVHKVAMAGRIAVGIRAHKTVMGGTRARKVAIAGRIAAGIKAHNTVIGGTMVTKKHARID